MGSCCSKSKSNSAARSPRSVPSSYVRLNQNNQVQTDLNRQDPSHQNSDASLPTPSNSTEHDSFGINRSDQIPQVSNSTDRFSLTSSSEPPSPEFSCYAIGDIEGREAHVQALLKFIDNTPDAQFVFLGDLFQDISDRYPERDANRNCSSPSFTLLRLRRRLFGARFFPTILLLPNTHGKQT
jgi:hypothetical protein